MIKDPQFCLSVFAGKYMTATYTKACEVDFETLVVRACQDIGTALLMMIVLFIVLSRNKLRIPLEGTYS